MQARFLRRCFAAGCVVTTTFLGGCGDAGDTRVASDDVTSDSVAPSPYWKNTLSFPYDPFVAGSGSDVRWVKFSIRTSEPTKVYFQDSNHYVFHYDFAKAHLPGFSEMGPSDFEKAALYANDQKLILGVVLLPRDLSRREFGVQLVRQDAYSKEDVKKLHDLVKSKIEIEDGNTARAFYMPTFEQREAAERDRAWLEQNDVIVGSTDRWLLGDACYAPGWAFGKAKFVPGADIKQAFLDGRLTYQDILVTDGVPAEVPYVAGIVSLAPSTPSSHVAILAKTWGIPFVFPKDEEARNRIRALDGKEIAVRAKTTWDSQGSCTLDVVEPRGTIDARTREALADLRRFADVKIPKKAHLGVLTKDAAGLTPDDVRYFGGKASNFGTLRRAIPDHSPKTLGVSFDLWDAFVAQTLPTGKTLAEEIDARLGGLTFPPDMAALESKLEEIRALVTDTARLPQAERTKLLADLEAFGFDPKVKIRFRSSTNVEDGDVLSGAGLYDSFSGCLADDRDADDAGPSACDASEAKERGVERAVKKVFASFFNTNAVLERLKYGIDEADVGMALAVHESFPDEREAANGVATLAIGAWSTTISLVTQLGAESVTNPTGGALPETVVASVFGDDVGVSLQSGSTRVPAGGTVMAWDADYKELAKLIVSAGKGFVSDRGLPANTQISLDIEYKKDTGGALILKQIRRIPEPVQPRSSVPVLLNEALSFCTFQGEYGNLLANHRLKARGPFETRNTPLSADDLSLSLVSKIDFEHVENGVITRTSGAPETFLGAVHRVDGNAYSDAWTSPVGTLTLATGFPRELEPRDLPIRLGRDSSWHLSARYASPVAAFDADGLPSTTLEDDVLFEPCIPATGVSDAVKTLEARSSSGVSIKTQFRYRAPLGGGMSYEKTFPLGSWESTEIQGLVSRPIVLKGWFSQTFRPGHHNFEESVLFEPALEEGISPEILQELDAKDIRALIVLNVPQFSGDREARFFVLKKSSPTIAPL